MGRTKAREIAFQLLFQYEAQKLPAKEVLSLYFDELAEKAIDNVSREYITTILNGVEANLSYLDDKIEPNLRDWKKDRISRVALASLRLAIFEIDFMDDVPYGVAVDEAVSIAKRYEGEECANFVNGILGKFKTREKE